jgi:hypothetical protein
MNNASEKIFSNNSRLLKIENDNSNSKLSKSYYLNE